MMKAGNPEHSRNEKGGGCSDKGPLNSGRLFRNTRRLDFEFTRLDPSSDVSFYPRQERHWRAGLGSV